MRNFILSSAIAAAAMLVAAPSFAAPAAKATPAAKAAPCRDAKGHFCSKAQPTPAPKPTPAAAAKPAPAPVTRNYDCSKAGNKNKAVCKAATPAPAAKGARCRAANGRYVQCGTPGARPA